MVFSEPVSLSSVTVSGPPCIDGNQFVLQLATHEQTAAAKSPNIQLYMHVQATLARQIIQVQKNLRVRSFDKCHSYHIFVTVTAWKPL